MVRIAQEAGLMVVYEKYLRAGNPQTPVNELRELLNDADARVRRRVAENPGTDSDMLRNLSFDGNAEVRIAVGEHEKTPRDILDSLCEDSDVYVRFALAGQYSLPIELLQRLREDDENPYVRDHASRTLEGLYLESALREAQFVPVEGKKEKLGELLVDAGVLSQTQVDELLRIAREREIPLGRAIVQNRALPREIIVRALKAQEGVREGRLTPEQACDLVKGYGGG